MGGRLIHGIDLYTGKYGISLQTLLLLFKCAKHRNKRPFVSTANEALIGTLMTIRDVYDVFPIKEVKDIDLYLIHQVRLLTGKKTQPFF